MSGQYIARITCDACLTDREGDVSEDELREKLVSGDKWIHYQDLDLCEMCSASVYSIMMTAETNDI